MRFLPILLALWLPVGCGTMPQTPAQEFGVFDYDKTRPLNARAEPLNNNPLSQSFKISFDGNTERATGILTVPKGVNKPPVLLILHGLGGDASQANIAGVPATVAGYATLALDAPNHGARSNPGSSLIPGDLSKMRQLWIDGVIDYRRALDYLETRDDVDASRVVLAGVSLGGMMGTLVAAADQRVGAAAIIIAGGDFGLIARESKLSHVSTLRRAFETEGEERASFVLSDIDPIICAPRISPRPVLFVNGTKDDVIPKASAERLISAAKDPKTVIWDDVGHIIAPRTLPRIYTWLLENTPK